MKRGRLASEVQALPCVVQARSAPGPTASGHAGELCTLVPLPGLLPGPAVDANHLCGGAGAQVWEDGKAVEGDWDLGGW